MKLTFGRGQRLASLFLTVAILSGLGSLAKADSVYLTVTGMQTTSIGSTPVGTSSYDATIYYDTSESPLSSPPSSPNTYDATLTDEPGGSAEYGTLTITPDPTGQDEIEFYVSGGSFPLYYTDEVDIYAPGGTFSGNLPTVSDWQSLISANDYQADVSGGYFFSTYQGSPMTLSVSNTAPVVPAPAAALGAIPLLGICAWLKRR